MTSRTSDLLGADPYPGSTPQAEEDRKEPGNALSDLALSLEQPTQKEYRWVYANGQLHVSPLHDHGELAGHAGITPEHTGPFAAGYVSLFGRDATWSAESNIALRGLSRVLEDYGKTVGWEWGGLVGGDGQPIHDELGAKKSMWYRESPDGQISISVAHFKDAQPIRITGKTAYVVQAKPGLEEWAADFGYRLAEYPGGGNALDKMKTWETLDGFDKGNPDAEPRPTEMGEIEGPIKCPDCGEELPDFMALQLHAQSHEGFNPEEIPDGHFPQVEDHDVPLPYRNRNSEPTAQPLASFKEASVIPGFQLYSNVWDFGNDDSKVFYGGYLEGKLVGYAVVREAEDPEVLMVYSSVPKRGVGTALMEKIKLHYPHFYTHANTEEGKRLLERTGAINVEGHLFKYGAGEEPKDMLQAPVPFIYDVLKDHITTGHPGMRTSDIMGQFTPEGIVEGYFEPGGKVKITTTTNMPYSTYHLLQLWYYQHPTMEITSLELETGNGETTKLASGESVGSYLKQLAATDPAAWNSYQALRQAGAKVYVVGGAVRDALLQKEPKDIDLMVSGIPTEEVNHILSNLPGRVDLTGKRFGVYRYRTKGKEVEIALPREDSYEDAEKRSEGKITVDHNLPIEDDLKRRDFTANSMAVDLDDGHLIDPYGGAKDIEGHVLRTTHPDSFKEDPTRLVRALVASSRHGLVPDERTRNEMSENASRLDDESPDALKQQLDKLLESPNPAGAVRLAQDTGVLKHLFPELANNFDYDQNNPHHKFTLGEHSLNVLNNVSRVSADPDVRLAALLHDIGKPASAWIDPASGVSHYYQGQINGEPIGADHAKVGSEMAEARLRSGFNFPVNRINRVRQLVDAHMFPAFSSAKGARRFLSTHGQHADDLLTIREGDMAGKGQTEDEIATKTSVDQMRNLVGEVRTQGQATDMGSLAINGNDIVAMGIQPGPQVGEILRSLMERVVEYPQLNNPTDLQNIARQYVGNQLPQ